MALSTTGARLPRRRRPADRHGAGGHDLRGRLRRDRPQRGAPSKRSWAMGVTAAAGSFGQFLMVPIEGGLIAAFGWQQALFVLGLRGAGDRAARLRPARAGARAASARRRSRASGAALREAFGDRSFQLLTAGYFVCGFQVVFIGVHMPSYLQGPRPDAGRRHDRAGADRPVQRVRHLRRRRARRAPAEDATCSRASTPCARWRSSSSCSRR